MTTRLVLLCQSTFLLLLGFLALRLTQKRGPAVQTLVGRASLASVALLVLLLPLTGHVQPVVRVPEPTLPQHRLPEGQPATLPKRDGAEVQPVGAPRAAPSALPTRSASPSPAFVSAPASAEPARPEGAASGAPTPPPLTVPHPPLRKAPATEERESKAVGLPALLLLFWLALCRYHLVRLRRAARPVIDGPAAALLAELTPNPPALLTHASVCSPFLAGTRRSAIFLPPTYAVDFTPDTLRAVFLHELAHRDRRDNLWTLAARLLTAVLWFQPLLWLLSRKMEQISEDACDEAVLASHCPPRAYADCLLSLAERWQPGRQERVLGVGVIPFRSSVGRRIEKILAAKRPSAGVTRGFRFGVPACALLAAFGCFVLLNADATVDLPHFLWAKQQAWAVQPIHVIDLDHPGLTPVAWLPYDITERDKAMIKQFSGWETAYYGKPGPPVSVKTRLEAVLAAQPHFFYAEYLLGSWYQQHGDMARASALQTQALRDAPVVLAGRYEYDDGTPVAGLRFGTDVLCFKPGHFRASNGAFQNLPVDLRYSNVVTDADGCYYLPAFRAIYSQQGVSWYGDEVNALTAPRLKARAALVTPGPATSGSTGDQDGQRLIKGFVAESRVAVLPQTQVRPVVMLNAPFNATLGSMQKPLPINGSTLIISWQPYPKAAQYVVRLFESRPIYGEHGKIGGAYSTIERRTIAPNSSPLGIPTTQTSISLNFMGDEPIFNRTYSYVLMVEAQNRKGQEISRSDQYVFQPRNALAPQPLTKASLAQALGPGFTVISIISQKDKVIVNVLTPANRRWTFATDDALEASGKRFGFSDYAGWSSSPGISMDAVNAAQHMQITYGRGP